MHYGIYSNNGIIPGMTIGPGNLNRFIIINPGDSAFESRNPGAMYVSPVASRQGRQGRQSLGAPE